MLANKSIDIDIVGSKIVCTYQGIKDPAPLKIKGTVRSKRNIEGKGNLLVVKTDDGYRSIYLEKAVDLTLYYPSTLSTRD